MSGKLFGLLDYESCKLLGTVQLVVSNKHHSLGINARTNICSVFNELDEGMECPFIKFTHYTTFEGTINMMESRDTLQGNLSNPEEWANSISMKINKSK